MIGQTISHYKILEKLGEGGMGVVYKAEDTKLKRTVALKFLSPQAVGTEEDKTRFIHEAQAAASLNHPNICTIYEIDEAEKQLFIAMEYIEGRSLKDLIEAGPLSLKEARDIAMQIAEGLHEAHNGYIVHRDIKPANIMITGGGRVKIMDFGLAKSSDWTKLTREGTTIGTVAYMSPEQTRGEEVDHRTDLWSVGVILYEMVSGQLPFKGDHEQAVIYSIVNEDPRQLTSLRTAVPLVLESITNKAMAKDKKNRYQHADELLVDLRSLKEEIDSASMATGIIKRGFRRRHLSLVFVIAIVIAAAFVLARLYLIPEKDKAIDSIAVLPLENLSGDPDQEYFADGMTEALIADLATMGSLKVISRTSVMRFKESRKPLPEIARELNVDAIVEGSILQISGRVRITAQLIEAVSDRHLWAESYERDMRDILALQRDVAHAIAREINIELAPREMADSTGARQVDPQAYEAYLMGRFFWNKRTKENLEKSIEFFERALARDPGYALAYTGLADAYLILSDWAYRPPKECYPRAKELVMKALEIDEFLAEAHTTLAYITGIYEWRWGEAEAGFKRAIQLNPNYATAHQWYAEYLCILGRFDEAIQEAQKAQELDPLLAAVHYIAGISFYYAGQFDRAIEQCEKAIVINEDFNGALFYMAQSFKEQGRQEKAFEGYLKTLLVCGLSEEKIPDLRSIFNTSGINGYFRWFIDDGYEQLKGPNEYHFLLSSAYLGETDLVFEVLERYVQERRRTIVEVGVEPAFNGLRSDPRFEDILQRIGLGH